MELKLLYKPPPSWDNQCSDQGNIFLHSQWHNVLKHGFNTQTIYLWDEDQSDGVSISLFKKSIFKIGYLGFPIGGTLKGKVLETQFLNSIVRINSQNLIPILRIPSGNFSPAKITCNSEIHCPETYISDLNSWSIKNVSKHCRRDIKKSIRENSKVEQITDPSYNNILYTLYKNTIQKNKGSIKYTSDYFKYLLLLSQKNQNVRCTCIKNKDQVIAFLVIIINRNVAYYLHGAIDYRFRKSLPNDLLIYDAIEWAKGLGSSAFNLMCSPQNQSSLIKYKEKWGGITSPNITYEICNSALHCAMFRFANSSIQVLNKIKRKFL